MSISLILKHVSDRELEIIEANNLNWLPAYNYKTTKDIIMADETEYNKAITLLKQYKTRY